MEYFDVLNEYGEFTGNLVIYIESDKRIWYNTNVRKTNKEISIWVKKIYSDLELESNWTVKEFLTVQKEGEREVKRKWMKKILKK